MNNIMKYQIRQGVFETNSSSSHSLGISHGTLEDSKKKVLEFIEKAYKSRFESDKLEIEDYIDSNGVFWLEGFWMEDGEEEGCVYYILHSWLSKVQYLAMILDSENQFGDSDIKKLKSYILPELNSRGFNVSDIKIDVKYSVYLEDNIPYIPGTGKVDIDKFFSEYIQDSCDLINCDEAYHPYKSPKIEIL